jgi:putative peptidoglycan lipid II flippase
MQPNWVETKNPSIKKKSPGLAKTFSLVAVLTVLSKFAGLARDIVVNQHFGLGLVADAYNYAYQLTGTPLVLFGGLGGPFHSSAVAILKPQKENHDTCARLMVQMLVWTGMICGLLSVALFALAALAVQFAPHIAAVIAHQWPGHDVEYYKRLIVEVASQVQIMSPLLLIAGLVGIGCGISNVYEEFFWPSVAPAFASMAIIAAVLVTGQTDTGTALAVGTLIGAVGQLAVQLPGMLKAKPNYFNMDIFTTLQPGMKEYLAMLIPATIGTSIGTLTTYVDMFFTGGLQEGGWAAICNANRLVQLPLGVLLTAMLVPILPRFSEQVTANKIDDLKAELRRALSMLWFLALPMSVLLLTCSQPIIELLFQRGHFTKEATAMLCLVLSYQVPSIFFYVARDLITRVFYAYKDSTTPFIVGIMAIFVKGFMDWLFITQFHMGIAGIALATTLITVFNLSCLFILLRLKTGRLGAVSLMHPIAVMLTASAVCAFSSFYLHNFISALPQLVALKRPIAVAIDLAISGGTGMFLYVGVCYVLKLKELQMVSGRVLDKLKPGRKKTESAAQLQGKDDRE